VAQVGETLGVDPKTVWNWTPQDDSGVENSTPEEPPRVIGKDGQFGAVSSPSK
jgi:hypothetical protein